ncbi:NADAR family protein [Tenacibaculum discolor]|uniref:NADAR family protein n=2 Tax=Tenacibaculum discolor TaxID=361581 RepID=A0ABT9F5X2_9FLAO|nr:NADAR family protein [Tenacibaculum discolor]MDP2542094.1 NADAR family protein [Tenacibaculum discolor]
MKVTLKLIEEKGLSDDIVKEMIEMSKTQSKEWKNLYKRLPDDIAFEYARIKGRIQKEEIKSEYLKLSQRDREIKHLRGFQYAAHHTEGLTFEEELIRNAKKRKDEKFTFFWATKSPFSQWYKCNFKAERIYRAPNYLMEFNEEIKFNSAEQYMMYNKCLLALDFDAADKVLRTKDPRKQKEIGRKIKMTKEVLETWEFFKVQIVYEGNKTKFLQNKELKKLLLETKGTTLVEAAPDDKIWGIGLSEDNPKAKDRLSWEGKNILGEVLTLIRTEILGEY